MKKRITSFSIYAMLVYIVTFAGISRLNAQCTPVISSSNPSSCTGGAVTLSVGVPGNAAGITSQYINLSSNTGLRTFMGNAFTLETWVKPNTTSGSQIIMYNGLCNQACPTFSLTIGGEGGCAGGNVANKYNFKFMTTAGNFNLVSTNAATTSWTHVAITYNGSNSMKMYINGTLDNTLAVSGTPNTTSFLFIGVDPGIGGCGYSRFQLNATLDEMRIWSAERSAAEINNNYANTVAANSANLLAYYPFNSSNGTTAFDATSNGYNGDFNAQPTWSASSAFGFSSFLWSPGGATTSSITVTTSGTYTVTAKNSSGCTGTASKTINTSAATSSSTAITACNSYSWNGVTYTASGNYTTTGLVNSKGCDSTAKLNLTIKNSSSSGSSVNICTNQLPYVWNGLTFTGNGTQTKTGLVNVKGCDSSATLTVNVVSVVTPTVSITTASNTVCSNNSVTFTATATNGGSSPVYQWRKNGNNIATGTSITLAPNTLSNGDMISCELTANNPCQTSSFAKSNVITLTVNPSPSSAGTLYNNGLLINGNTITYCTIGTQNPIYSSVGGGVWSGSNNSAVNVNSLSAAGITTVNTGNSILTYTVSNSYGCKATISVILIVAPQATPSVTNGASTTCVGLNTAYANPTAGGIWSVNGRGTITAGGVMTPTSAGSTAVLYTVTNANGCSATTSLPVTINAVPAVPDVSFAPGNTVNPQAGAPGGSMCRNRTFNLTGSPSGGSWGSTGVYSVTSAGVVSTGSVAGNGTFFYTVSNNNGCKNSRIFTYNVAICATKGVKSEQLTANSFTVYPNPAHSLLTISCKLVSGTIILTDLYGKLIKQQPISLAANIIDVSNFAKGIYFVSVITEQGKQTQKVVVE